MYAVYNKILEVFRLRDLSREEALAYMETDAEDGDIILRRVDGQWYRYGDQVLTEIHDEQA